MGARRSVACARAHLVALAAARGARAHRRAPSERRGRARARERPPRAGGRARPPGRRVAGLADDLDEQRVLERIADAALALARPMRPRARAHRRGCTVARARARPPGGPPRSTPERHPAPRARARRRPVGSRPPRAALHRRLAVVRRDRPFSAVELAQLRVLADFGARPATTPACSRSRARCGRRPRSASASAPASPTAC